MPLPSEINPYVFKCVLNNGKTNPVLLSDIPRIVQWYEMELIVDGDCLILHDERQIPTRKGRVVFYTPGQRVRATGQYHSYVINFDMRYDPQLAGAYRKWVVENYSRPVDPLFLKARPCLPFFANPDFEGYLDVSQYQEFLHQFTTLYATSLETGPMREFMMKAQMMHLLLTTLHAYWDDRGRKSMEGISPSTRTKIYRARAYMDERLTEKLRLDDIAEAVELSVSCLCRSFKKVIGVTPVAYITRARIHKAKKMLAETDLPVKSIVYECGFSNYSYFFTTFKRLEGESPIMYKNAHCAKWR